MQHFTLKHAAHTDYIFNEIRGICGFIVTLENAVLNHLIVKPYNKVKAFMGVQVSLRVKKKKSVRYSS